MPNGRFWNHLLRAARRLPLADVTRALPPHQITYAWFARFRDDGTWQTVNHHLLMLDSLPTPDFQALAEAFRDGL